MVHGSRFTAHNSRIAALLPRAALYVLCSVSCVLAAASAAHAAVTVSANVDADTVGIEDTLTLTVSINGDADQLTPPDVEAQLTDFRVLGQQSMQQTSIVNFKVSHSYNFVYTLLPKRQGALRIPELKVFVNGNGYSTKPIVVNVQAGSVRPQRRQQQISPWDPWGRQQQQPQQRQTPSEEDMRDGVRLVAALASGSVFVGQPIFLRYRILSRYPMANISMVEQPKFENFLVETIPDQAHLEPRQVNEDGKAFYEVEIFTRWLIPTQAGRFELEPLTLGIEVQTGVNRGFFSMGPFTETIHRRSTAAALTARPLPQPEPEGFCGAVGEFTLKENLSAERLDASDALTYKIILEGKGNVRALRPPRFPATTAFTVHDPEIKYDVKVDKTGIRGRAEITYLLLPRATGRQKIPPLTLVTFNPRAGKYEAMPTLGGEVTVEGTARTSVATLPEPSAADSKSAAMRRPALPTDIHPIRAEGAPEAVGAPLHRRPGALAFWLGAPVALNAAAAAAMVFRRKMKEDSVAYRARRARRDATRMLKEGSASLAAGRKDEAFQKLEDAMREFAAAKARRPAAGLTPAEMESAFLAARVTEGTARAYVQLFSKAQGARYGAVDATLDEKAFEQAAELVRLADRQWRERK